MLIGQMIAYADVGGKKVTWMPSYDQDERRNSQLYRNRIGQENKLPHRIGSDFRGCHELAFLS